MRTITIHPNNQADYKLFVSLAQRLKTTYVEDTETKKKELLEGVECSVKEIKQHLDGEIKLQDAYEFLKEL
jgi:hypothetical protein